MCCWLLIAWAFAPRVALVLMWLLTDRIARAFDGFLLPLVGFFLVPWTTFAYALVAPGGVNIFEFVILVVALVADLSSWGGGYRYRSQRSD
jgi:hypothetical protein